MSELTELIEDLKIDIENLDMDLITKKEELLRLEKSTDVKNNALYNGLITELYTQIKEVKERNNFYGHTQGDTEPYFIMKIAYIDTGPPFLTKEQKQIVLDYHKKENDVKKIVVNGKPYYS